MQTPSKYQDGECSSIECKMQCSIKEQDGLYQNNVYKQGNKYFYNTRCPLFGPVILYNKRVAPVFCQFGMVFGNIKATCTKYKVQLFLFISVIAPYILYIQTAWVRNLFMSVVII